MTPIALAVLDLAGTTAQENGIVEKAVRTAVHTVTDGNTPPHLAERFHAMRGGSKIDMFRHILDRDEHLAHRAHDLFEQDLLERIRAGQVQPIPGAADTLAHLRDRGIRTALTTGFSPTVRDELLDVLDWRPLIDLALSPQDAGRGRPHPDLIWTAALRLHADSCTSIAVVGDTSNDLHAGTRAGAGIVAGVLTGAHKREQLELAPRTHILNTVNDLLPLIDELVTS
ncbi:HAD family hydrolase [Nonomuraea sp. NPDC046802]|uniref:HAD family hydrolase n=1 Tax=Nonomuraea sp. NPDC046802 TaxID=3154919 RepID=UPI003410DD08